MKKSEYCPKRHGIPNGACCPMPVGNCKVCGQTDLNHLDWYCPNCYRCLDCQRIVKSKVKNGIEPAIPTSILIDPHRGKERIKIPKFTHSKEHCRNYRLEPSGVAKIQDFPTGINLYGNDIQDLLNGNLGLIR